MRSSQDLRFAVVCVVLFVAGALLRFESGWLTPPSLAPNVTLTARSEPPAALAPGLSETVSSFYSSLDRGLYANAYRLSLENKWRAGAPNNYQPVGLTSENEFVRAATAAWNVNGADLTINTIDVLRASPLEPDRRSPSNHPELYTLDSLSPDTPVDEVYEVAVRGSLLERCSTWEWSKTLLVARLGSGDWKILLPGNPGQRIPLLEAWFLDNDSFAELDLLDKE